MLDRKEVHINNEIKAKKNNRNYPHIHTHTHTHQVRSVNSAISTGNCFALSLRETDAFRSLSAGVRRLADLKLER